MEPNNDAQTHCYYDDDNNNNITLLYGTALTSEKCFFLPFLCRTRDERKKIAGTAIAMSQQ